MLSIAESLVDAASATAFARAHRGVCELFVEPRTDHHVAIVAKTLAHDARWTVTPLRLLFDGGRYGAAAGPWLFRVGLHVPTEQRVEFLDWYEHEHLPILLECPAWDGCRFVEAPAAHGCQFFALHQLTSRTALESAQRARSRATAWFRRLKQYAWFDEAFTRTLYERVDVR